MEKTKVKWIKDSIGIIIAVGLLLVIVLVFSAIHKKADLQSSEKSDQENDIVGAGCYGQ